MTEAWKPQKGYKVIHQKSGTEYGNMGSNRVYPAFSREAALAYANKKGQGFGIEEIDYPIEYIRYIVNEQGDLIRNETGVVISIGNRTRE